MYQFQITDLPLAVVYVIVLFIIIVRISERMSPLERKHMRLGFALKMLGSVLFFLVYLFYYGEGDTIMYYQGAKEVWKTMLRDPGAAFRLLSLEAGNHTAEFEDFTPYFRYFPRDGEWLFTKVAGVINLFCLNNFLCLSIAFSTIAFAGLWAIYQTFAQLYPTQRQSLFVWIFLPISCLLWTSGLLKDALCIGLVGLTFWSAYRFSEGRKIIVSILLMSGSLVLIGAIKPYLAYTFLMCLLVWLYFRYMATVQDQLFKGVLGIIVSLIFVLLAANFVDVLEEASKQRAYQESIVRVKAFQREYGQSQQNDSKYLIELDDYSPSGLMLSAPEALFTALVRPFPWEVRKPVMALMTLEHLTFLAALFLAVSHPSFSRNLPKHLRNPDLIFCLLFVVLLGIIVGLTSSNFGLLMRVKTPYMPFLGVFVVILSQEVDFGWLRHQKLIFASGKSPGTPMENGR